MISTQRSVIAAPQAFELLAQGIELMATPLIRTLGPGNGFVINERSRGEIEMLEDSSTIARRVIKLPHPGSNLSAMMLRKAALDLHDHFGDGIATAAVITLTMVREASRMLAAGAHPVMIARGLKLALDAATASLQKQAQPITDEDQIIALVNGITADPELSQLLGQMFDTLGENATIITQDVAGPYLDHEYIRGSKWDGYIPIRQLIPAGKAALILHHPLILLANEDITSVEQVQPALELALAAPDKPPLLIIARNISDAALTMISTNHSRGILTIGTFILSSGRTLIHDDLEDIATLTGGQVFSHLTGTLASKVQSSQFGQARQVIISENGLTIAGGKGLSRTIQQRISGIRTELKSSSRSEQSAWELLRIRLARLAGGIGVLKIGARTEQERELKKDQIAKTLRVLEAAYTGGLVPGGGVAFLDCLPALDTARTHCRHGDEIYGVNIMEAALTAPFLQIVRNHGLMHPALALDTIQQHATPGYGLDILRGDFVMMSKRHILDCQHVAQGALEAATSIATMLLTTNTIVFTTS